MAAPSFSLLFLSWIVGVAIGSESEKSSLLGIQNNMTRLEHKVLQLEDKLSSVENKLSSVENSIAAIPQKLQAENEQLLITVLDEMEIKFENYANTNKEMGEALRKELETLQSNHSPVELSLRHQTLQIDELSRQMEDVQNSCFGEPPSPQNGRPMDFKRKQGSDVRYRCDENFWMTGNSTVRCRSGKWEGQPPVCRFFDASFLLRAQYYGDIRNVTCSSEVSDQKMEFSRDLDTGVSGAFPSGANVYSLGKSSVLDLSGVSRGDKPGDYTCGYEKDGTRTGISFRVYGRGWFVRGVVASIGDIAELGSRQFSDRSVRWFHEGRYIPSGDGRGNLTITGVKVTDAGTYERKHEYHSYFFKFFVRGCRANVFGEGCERECPPCYNGGTCHDLLGVCVCPPGFAGTNCELACGENKFGANCSESCLRIMGTDCQLQIFCKPYPAGCSCAPGYEGFFCTGKCKEGKFGADCKQTCRCAEGSCNPFTGACPGGCSPGWTGQSCQIPA